MTASATADGRNHLFDGMRGIAAILIVVYHVGFALCRQPVAAGYLAVDFFFVLSGWVLARAYDARFAAGLSASRFIRMRLVRLYPLFAVGLVLGLLLKLAQIAFLPQHVITLPHLAADFAIEALMLPTPVGSIPFSLNNPSWSLMFELLINIAYALVLFRLRRPFLVALAVLGAIGTIAGVAMHGDLNLGWAWKHIFFGLTRVTFGFIAGMLLARRSGPRHATPLAFAAVAILIAALVVPVAAEARGSLDLGFALVITPLLIGFGAVRDVPVRARRSFAWLGDISYALYATHMPIITGLTAITKSYDLPRPAAFVLAIGSALIAASLAERFIDRPARRWLSQRLGLRESALPQARLSPAMG